MRLFVIGHFSKGKSTVIAALRRKRQSRTFDERTRRTLDPNCHLTEDGTTCFVTITLCSVGHILYVSNDMQCSMLLRLTEYVKA